MLWSWRCFGHFGHKRLRGISIVFNRFSKILNDFVRFSSVFSNFSRFSAILGDLQRFWAISGVLGTLLGALGRSWDALGALLGRSWDALGASWALLGASWTPLGRNLEKKQLHSDFGAPTWRPKSSQVSSKIVEKSMLKNKLILMRFLLMCFAFFNDFHFGAKSSIL